MKTKIKLTCAQFEVYQKLAALREIEWQNNMSTKRAQNKILQSLSEDDLAVVTQALMNVNSSYDYEIVS